MGKNSVQCPIVALNANRYRLNHARQLWRSSGADREALRRDLTNYSDAARLTDCVRLQRNRKTQGPAAKSNMRRPIPDSQI
jgi:hypothetical protein